MYNDSKKNYWMNWYCCLKPKNKVRVMSWENIRHRGDGVWVNCPSGKCPTGEICPEANVLDSIIIYYNYEVVLNT